MNLHSKKKNSGLIESKNSLFTLIAANSASQHALTAGFSAVPGEGVQYNAHSGAAETPACHYHFPPALRSGVKCLFSSCESQRVK